MASNIVLSYHDSLLRQEDMDLFRPPNWLNDKLIGFYFEYLERDVFTKDQARVSFITPDVTQFIKLYTGPELGIFLDPLHLSSKEVVILAVNSNSSLTTAGGSHWSTLVYSRAENVFEHYDSSRSFNKEEALKCAHKLADFVKAADSDQPRYIEVQDSPQQENGYDCGVYCVLMAEYIAKTKLSNSLTAQQQEPIPGMQLIKGILNQNSVSKWRQQTPQLIQRLQHD